MSRLVEKVNLPVYGEMYIACAEEASLETIQALQEPLKKLYEYEQEEESGTLVHLPCKLGDISYYICNEDDDGNKGWFIFENSPISAIAIKEDGFYIQTDGELDKIGCQWALLTREDAEKKLKEMEDM